MFYQIRRHISSYTSIAVGVVIFFALIILTTGIASAAPASDHLEACSVNVSSSFTGPLNLVDLGAEFDSILEAELEAARCAIAELEQEFDHVLDLFLPQESLQEVSQGLDQDLRLSEELSAALEVLSSFDARITSEGRAARQFALQESRDANLDPELTFDFDFGADQDLRLSEELSAALEVVSSFDARITSEGRVARQFALQESRDANLDPELTFDFDFGADRESRDANLDPELTFDFDFGADQDFRLAAELSASQEAVLSLNSR